MKISVKVKPCAKEDRVEKLDENNFLVWVKEKPEDGRANKKAVEILAKAFGLAKSNIILLKGQASRHKIFDIRGLVRP